jgi:hypothetical protein
MGDPERVTDPRPCANLFMSAIPPGNPRTQKQDQIGSSGPPGPRRPGNEPESRMAVTPLRRKAAVVILTASAAGLLGGCQIPGLTTSTAPSSTTLSPGPTGFLYLAGSRQPSPPPAGAGAAAPLVLTASLPPLPTAAPQPTRTATIAVPDACAGRLHEGKLDTLTVVANAGSATVTWNNAGDTSVTAYRVAAVPQNLSGGTQPPIAWHPVAPGKGCAPISTTITGLRRGGWYVFWLDATATSPTRPGAQDVTIGESSAVQIR